MWRSQTKMTTGLCLLLVGGPISLSSKWLESLTSVTNTFRGADQPDLIPLRQPESTAGEWSRRRIWGEISGATIRVRIVLAMLA